jgi:hypothetical protein
VGRFVREKPLAALLIAVAVVLVGRLVDLQWHLTHDEFEGTTEQVRAHLVVWIGVLLVLAMAVLALRHGVSNPGFSLALAGASLYVPVAVWHFIEHANGSDPEVAHVLLVIADVAIFAGAVVAIVIDRQRRGAVEAAGLSE